MMQLGNAINTSEDYYRYVITLCTGVDNIHAVHPSMC